ncbi:3-hydroxyacyl-ACP dehydratase FabZ [Defluviitalea saccharophila]|uniref:3-hydroxyacyl-[acyl-carrier-protein] dehydratase FabZ n=1 Tax=Defluviitalea saccharophila TaxID=879970 RepID=A0ABZ2Y1C1_9FIRM
MLNIKQIQEIIPHRYPFLLIDKIEDLEPGIKAVGYKNVTMNEYFFQGHFPSEPVMPGVLIIEALAQVGAVCLLSLEDLKGKIAYFGGIEKARFREKVIPGDVLRLEVEIIKRRGPIGIGSAKAFVGDKKVCEAELTFAIG